MKLQELLQKRSDTLTRMRAILDLVEDEKREMTEDESKEYNTLDASVDKQNEAIEREKKLMDMETRKEEVVNPLPFIVKKHGDKDPEKEFKNIGEYFWAIAARHYDHRQDKRLDGLREKTEQREQSFGTGTMGGFALPEQFRPEIWQVDPQQAIVRPRATVLPAGDPPDARLTMPALDQTAAQNIYGGVIMTHGGEAITLTETDAHLKQITMEPKKIAGYIVCTSELLNNWGAASSFITGQMQKARIGMEDYDFLRGDGINKAIGVINAPCAVNYNRAVNSAIDMVDITGMYARLKMGGSPVWLASQTTIPQLVTMADAGTHSVWLASGGGTGQNGLALPMPPTLMGYPVIFADRLPGLGSKGDLMLVDLNYYLIKEGSGPDVALSTELLFLSDRVVFRITWRVDGKPWLTEALGLEGSTGNTVSPFVILDVA
jgi:HK97 family phage major capsid protein